MFLRYTHRTPALYGTVINVRSIPPFQFGARGLPGRRCRLRSPIATAIPDSNKSAGCESSALDSAQTASMSSVHSGHGPHGTAILQPSLLSRCCSVFNTMALKTVRHGACIFMQAPWPCAAVCTRMTEARILAPCYALDSKGVTFLDSLTVWMSGHTCAMQYHHAHAPQPHAATCSARLLNRPWTCRNSGTKSLIWQAHHSCARRRSPSMAALDFWSI